MKYLLNTYMKKERTIMLDIIRPSSSLDNQKKKGKSPAKQAHHLWLYRTPPADLELQKVKAQASAQVRGPSALDHLRNLGQASTQASMETSQQQTTFISDSPEFVFPTVDVPVQGRTNSLNLLKNRGRLSSDVKSSLNDLKTLAELLQFIPDEHHNTIKDAYRRARKAFKEAANKERKGPEELVNFVEQYYSVKCEEKRGTLYYQFEPLDPEKYNAVYIDIEPSKGIMGSASVHLGDKDEVHFSDFQRYVCITGNLKEMPLKEYHSDTVVNKNTLNIVKALYYAGVGLNSDKIPDGTMDFTRESAAFMPFLGAEVNLSMIYLASDLGLNIQSVAIQRVNREAINFQLKFTPA